MFCAPTDVFWDHAVKSNLWHRLTLCLIFAAIFGGILINLPDAIQAVWDLFGV